MAASYGYLGRAEPAREAVEKMMELVPNLSAEHLKSFLPEAVANNYIAGLHKAGWSG